MTQYLGELWKLQLTMQQKLCYLQSWLSVCPFLAFSALVNYTIKLRVFNIIIIIIIIITIIIIIIIIIITIIIIIIIIITIIIIIIIIIILAYTIYSLQHRQTFLHKIPTLEMEKFYLQRRVTRYCSKKFNVICKCLRIVLVGPI